MTGYQLIYTNVEADRSPTRQRGFQVWLASPELSPEARRAAAKRLDDFRLPPGVAPDDPAAVRHVYARLPDGLALIARTVPLTDRDKFGRGGKFHAHAVLLPDEAFRDLGCDPFRVIDGGFRFHARPDDAGDLWQTGDLPPADLGPGDRFGDGAELPPKLVGELLAHAERGDDKPVVVADRPAEVLKLLRGLVRAFPPSARARLTFDTLSTGAPSEVRPVVAGAYSPDVLRLWSSKKYHRLDPAAGTVAPPLAPVVGLPAELPVGRGWAALSDVDRDAAAHAARALADGRLADLRPADLSPAALAALASCPAFRPAVAEAATAASGKAVPAALVDLPEVAAALAEHFCGPPADALARLAEPIPREVVTAGLLASPVWRSEPPPAALAALQEWVAQPTRRTLVRVLRRWRGSPDDLAALEADIARPDAEGGAFRHWLTGTLRNRSLAELRGKIGVGRPAAAKDLRDARLWLAVHPDPADPGFAELKLGVTLFTDPRGLARVIVGPPRLAGAEDWLARAVAGRVRERAVFRWADDGLGNTFLGAFVAAADAADEALLAALVGLGHRAPVREVLAALGLAGAAGPAAPADVAPVVPEAGKRLHREVLAAGPERRPAAVAAYRAFLAGADDETYRVMANVLLQQVGGGSAARAVDDSVYFVGLRLVWVQQSNPAGQLGLFGAVAGAAVPEYAVGTPLPAAKALGPQAARRLAWLMARLADPAGTERFKV